MEKTTSIFGEDGLTPIAEMSRDEIISKLREADALPINFAKMTDAQLGDLLQEKYDEGMLGFLFKR